MFDNDNDMRVDCADPDCDTVVPCGAPVPASSPGGTALLVAVLGLLGLYRTARWAGAD